MENGCSLRACLSQTQHPDPSHGHSTQKNRQHAALAKVTASCSVWFASPCPLHLPRCTSSRGWAISGDCRPSTGHHLSASSVAFPRRGNGSVVNSLHYGPSNLGRFARSARRGWECAEAIPGHAVLCVKAHRTCCAIHALPNATCVIAAGSTQRRATPCARRWTANAVTRNPLAGFWGFIRTIVSQRHGFDSWMAEGNKDNRLGFICTYCLFHKSQLGLMWLTKP